VAGDEVSDKRTGTLKVYLEGGRWFQWNDYPEPDLVSFSSNKDNLFVKESGEMNFVAKGYLVSVAWWPK